MFFPALLSASGILMENGSPSRRSWADEAEEELPSPQSFGAGSPGLFLERVSLSDSEDYSDSKPSQPPPGKGKAVAEEGGHRRRPRCHRH